MRKKLFYLLGAALIAAFATVACSKDDKDNGSDDEGKTPSGGSTYTLIAAPLTLDFGWNNPAPQTVTVTTNAPDGYVVGETASWYTAVASGNKVTVTAQSNDGDARTHVLRLTAKDANDVTIVINQAAKGEIAASLQGSKYIVYTLDATSAEYLGDKIIFSMVGTDKTDIHIWSAGETLVADETATGPGFYGINNSGYMALQTAGIGWSGGGFFYNDDTETDLPALWQQIHDDNGENWFFHVAFKGTKGAGNAFRFCDSDPDAASSFWIHCDDYDFTENDWTEVEIPFTTILAGGWKGATHNYTLTFHGGSGSGQKFHWDAMFIYKK